MVVGSSDVLRDWRSIWSLPQNFTEFLPGRCHVALGGPDDPYAQHFRGADKWAVEQSFSARVSENRGRDREAAPGFNFSDERTGAVAFCHNARLQTERTEHAVKPDRKSTRLNSSHFQVSRMPSSA